MTNEPAVFRQSFHLDGPRDVTIHHDGTSDLLIDGVLFYRAPEPRPESEPRRSPIEWLRDRWFFFRNGTPRGLQ